MQSLPHGHALYSAPSPPSSQSASDDQLHVSPHSPGGSEGGDGGEGGDGELGGGGGG